MKRENTYIVKQKYVVYYSIVPPQASNCQFHLHVYAFCPKILFHWRIYWFTNILSSFAQFALCHRLPTRTPGGMRNLKGCDRYFLVFKCYNMLVKLTTGLQEQPIISTLSTDLVEVKQFTPHQNLDLDPFSSEFAFLQFSDESGDFFTFTTIPLTKEQSFHSWADIKFLLTGIFCFSVKLELEESFRRHCVG